jgi:hypothetical protein
VLLKSLQDLLINILHALNLLSPLIVLVPHFVKSDFDILVHFDSVIKKPVVHEFFIQFDPLSLPFLKHLNFQLIIVDREVLLHDVLLSNLRAVGF